MPAREKGAGVGGGRGVADGRARGDQRRVVAGDVGDDQRQRPGRPGGRGELAALHPAQVLADDVHRADRRAGGEERVVDRLLLGEGDGAGGLDEQRRAAAGDQRQDGVAVAEAGDEVEHPRGGGEAAGVGDRVRGLGDLDAAGRAAVAVAGEDEALAGAPGGLHRLGHAGGGLAGADDDDAAGGLRRERGGDAAHRVGGGDGAVEEAAEEGAGRGQGAGLSAGAGVVVAWNGWGW